MRSPNLPKIVPTTLFISLLLALSGVNAAEVVNVPSIWPRGSIWHEKLSDACREIARATRGRVDVRLHDQAVLEYVPELGVYSLPLMFKSKKELDFARSQMDEELMRIIREKGFVPLALEEVGAGHIFATSTDINSLQDFKNSKLWIPKGKPSDAFESFGIANPVPAALPEVKLKITLGKIESFVATPSTVVLARWPISGRTPLPTPSISMVSERPLMYFVAPLVVYPQGYSSISKPDQKVVKDILVAAFADASQSNRQKDNEALELLRRREGVTFEDFVDPNNSEWQAWSATVRKRLVSDGKLPSSLVGQMETVVSGYSGS